MGGPEIRTEISGITGSRGYAWADHPNVGGTVINPTDNATEIAHSFQLNEFPFPPESAHRATELRRRSVVRSEGRRQQREEASAAAMRWGGDEGTVPMKLGVGGRTMEAEELVVVSGCG